MIYKATGADCGGQRRGEVYGVWPDKWAPIQLAKSSYLETGSGRRASFMALAQILLLLHFNCFSNGAELLFL